MIAQDISEANMLVNHYSASLVDYTSEARRKWRTADTSNEYVRYCLTDFNISLLLPGDVRRIPSRFALDGCPHYHPPDVWAGEYEYDPYAFDVGCMGNLFASEFDVSLWFE